MSWDRRLTNLNEMLADLYPTIEDGRRMAVKAGLRPAFIKFDAAAITNWFHILESAEQRGRVDEIVAAAREEFPGNDLLAAIERREPPAVKGSDIRREIPWRGRPSGDQLEKITGRQSTMVDLSFLEVGLQVARAVGRIVLQDGSSGTGFLIGGGLLLTNHHVLQSPEWAAGARFELNYQLTVDGRDAPKEVYFLDPRLRFATDATDDWTAVAVKDDPAQKWGAIALQEASPQVEDFVSIVQHPGGGPKQIAMFHNTVAYVGEGRVQYLTDTLPGSSGAPVFDQQWRVVAMHHSGGFLRQPGSTASYYRNEGIHINSVLAGLHASGLVGDSRE